MTAAVIALGATCGFAASAPFLLTKWRWIIASAVGLLLASLVAAIWTWLFVAQLASNSPTMLASIGDPWALSTLFSGILTARLAVWVRKRRALI